MKRALELTCAAGGLIFAVLFFIGFVGMARFLPPLSPAATADQILATYRENANSIRSGLIPCYLGCGFFLAFGSAIAAQTRRIRGVSQTVIYLQVSGYASSVLLILLPIMFWWVAAFRPDTAPAVVVQALNDFGWLSFVIGLVPFVTWFIAIGLSILSDEAEVPLFPRWSGYLMVLMALVQVPPVLLVYFKTGPFAWDGLLSWWIPFTDFFIMFMILTVVTIKAVNRGESYELSPRAVVPEELVEQAG